MARSDAEVEAGPALLRAGVVVVDDFLQQPLAEAMRRDIDEHFARPMAHRAETHQVWNYWFVPELYTYLRTGPEKVIGREHVEAFMRALRNWSLGTLGMGKVTWPYLSLYVSGCRQGWHNDSTNGRFGFVYSLTMGERRTTGGETLIFREGDPFRGNLTRGTAGRGLYEAIEPRFNRLVAFDDRLTHAVAQVEGVMDPVEGRFVLHGHLSEASTAVGGALTPDQAAGPLNAALRAFAGEIPAELALYHGPLVLRLVIAKDGAVRQCAAQLDRVMHRDPGHADWEPVLARLIECVRAVEFPPADGETTVIQPVIFGGALPRRDEAG
jgi:hypothetical protein